MPTILKDLQLDRIDFVDDGANPGARITLFKRKETPMADEKDIPTTEAVEVAKREAAEAKAQVAELTKRAEVAEAKAKADAEAIEKMRERLDRDESLAIAKRFTRVAPVDDLAGLILKAKRAFSAEDYTKFEAILKGAEEKIASGKLFAELGTGGQGGEVSNTDKLNALVTQEVTKRGGKETFAMVYADITKSHPEARALYTAIQKEGR